MKKRINVVKVLTLAGILWLAGSAFLQEQICYAKTIPEREVEALREEAKAAKVAKKEKRKQLAAEQAEIKAAKEREQRFAAEKAKQEEIKRQAEIKAAEKKRLEQAARLAAKAKAEIKAAQEKELRLADEKAKQDEAKQKAKIKAVNDKKQRLAAEQARQKKAAKDEVEARYQAEVKAEEKRQQLTVEQAKIQAENDLRLAAEEAKQKEATRTEKDKTLNIDPQVTISEPEMVTIPAGSFTMGCVKGRDDIKEGCSNDELPSHSVHVNGFMLGKTEVTFEQWDACTEAGVCVRADHSGWSQGVYKNFGRGNRPVINISWNDIQVYIKWLNIQTGKNYRLPSEAEWEYAARGGQNDTTFPGGNEIDCANADFGDNDCRMTNFYYSLFMGYPISSDVGGPSPVASYAPNGYGLYDMAGNVDEFVADCWHSTYINAPDDGSEWISSCKEEEIFNRSEKYRQTKTNNLHVVRGGSWASSVYSLRSAGRSYEELKIHVSETGFRLARTN